MHIIFKEAVIYVFSPNPYLFHYFFWVYHILFTPLSQACN